MRSLAIFRIILSLFAVLSLSAPATTLAATADWQPGPDAVLDNTYTGSIDQPAGGATLPANQPLTISGWVVDRAADGWAGIDNVHVYNGLAGEGGLFLGRALFALPRPDVVQVLGNPFWTNSGFSLSLSPGALGPGAHTLTVYAHTPEKGWWFNQVAIIVAAPVAAAQPAPAPPPINVLVRPSMVTISKQMDHYSIKGYALDLRATSGSGIDHVDLFMDDMRGHGGTLIGRASLGQDQPEAAAKFGPQFETAGYQLDFKPADFAVGDHHIYAYAVSSITGLETVAVTGFAISH